MRFDKYDTGGNVLKVFKKVILITVILVLIFIAFKVWWIYDNSIFIKPSDYIRAMYSIVLYNTTDDNITDISVFYQKAGDNYDTRIEFEHVSNLSANSYKKVNIPTDIQENGSYNVYVKIGDQSIASGYFGTKVGGFSVIKVRKENGTLILERVFESTREYKKLYRRHLKNQFETLWR